MCIRDRTGVDLTPPVTSLRMLVCRHSSLLSFAEVLVMNNWKHSGINEGFRLIAFNTLLTVFSKYSVQQHWMYANDKCKMKQVRNHAANKLYLLFKSRLYLWKLKPECVVHNCILVQKYFCNLSLYYQFLFYTCLLYTSRCV